jgi:phospholipase/carboxylesterase
MILWPQSCIFLNEDLVMADKNAKLSLPKMNTTMLKQGVYYLGIGEERDGLLYVPSISSHGRPLLVLLHGHGGEAAQLLLRFKDIAEQTGTVLLLPESRLDTWDLLERGSYGPDLSFIDRALANVFSQIKIDFDYIAIGGLGDGASYALSLGMGNEDFFSTIMAFSPGPLVPEIKATDPAVYISHGEKDLINDINECSRSIVPQLENAGVKVVYNEFSGGHAIPLFNIKEAFRLFLNQQHLLKWRSGTI